MGNQFSTQNTKYFHGAVSDDGESLDEEYKSVVTVGYDQCF